MIHLNELRLIHNEALRQHGTGDKTIVYTKPSMTKHLMSLIDFKDGDVVIDLVH